MKYVASVCTAIVLALAAAGSHADPLYPDVVDKSHASPKRLRSSSRTSLRKASTNPRQPRTISRRRTSPISTRHWAGRSTIRRG
jgi:hypothetical protein